MHGDEKEYIEDFGVKVWGKRPLGRTGIIKHGSGANM
jgi:hypothetical protein